VKSAAIAISFPVYASAGMSEIALNRRTFEPDIILANKRKANETTRNEYETSSIATSNGASANGAPAGKKRDNI